MHTGIGQVVELRLENGIIHAGIACAANLIPSPGQYLSASTTSRSDPLPVSLFSTESTPQGFIACGPIPEAWKPGTEIYLRGPLGNGFVIPSSARKVALVVFDGSPLRLRALMRIALRQGAAVVLICNGCKFQSPDEVEIQPLSALGEIIDWADYIAYDVAREIIPELKQMLEVQNRMVVKGVAEVLIHTPMPCGGIAECGVCAVTLKSNWKLSCVDGPVFNWSEI